MVDRTGVVGKGREGPGGWTVGDGTGRQWGLEGRDGRINRVEGRRTVCGNIQTRDRGGTFGDLSDRHGPSGTSVTPHFVHKSRCTLDAHVSSVGPGRAPSCRAQEWRVFRCPTRYPVTT